MAGGQGCGHEHVEDLVVDDPRLRGPKHRARYLKCVDCGLITTDASQEPPTTAEPTR